MWSGSGQLYVGDMGWVDAQANDVAMAPCGVMHGHRSTVGNGSSMMGGFASPPQLDLMIPTAYYADGSAGSAEGDVKTFPSLPTVTNCAPLEKGAATRRRSIPASK